MIGLNTVNVTTFGKGWCIQCF